MIIKTWRDPYDAGFNTIRPKEIDIHNGITVLVGCNGAGKTTLLLNVKEECENNKIPVRLFDNIRDGGNNAFGAILGRYSDMPCDNISMAMSMCTSSEGENIKLNIQRQSSLYQEFFRTGYFKNSSYRLAKIFDEKEKAVETNKRVLLFDATDSGLSIDNICEIKDFFARLITDAEEMGMELYILISANEFELCRESDCFDVNKGKYIRFNDYDDYRKFILASREDKEKRIEKQLKWRERQKAKEEEQYEVLKRETDEKIQKIKDKGDNLSWADKDKIYRLEQKLKDYVRHARFLTKP